MALPEAEKGKTDAEILAAAEENMKFMGGDPSADEPLPDDEPISEDLLEEVDEDAVEEDEPNSDDDSDDKSTPVDDDDDDAGTDDDDDKDEDAHKATDGKGDKPQLTDAYYRAAIHSGYTEEEVVEFMKANPTLALKTFAKMHDAMNSVSNEFAKIGRLKKKQADEPEEKPDDKSGFKPIDLEKLREEFPNDALVDVIDQMQSQSKAMFDELASRPANTVKTDQLATDQQQLADDKLAIIGEQIDSFFKGPGMEQYAVVYGTLPDKEKSWDGLLPSEKTNRLAVIEQVEELISGAKAMGSDMDVVDALGRAHLLVTSPVRDKMIRKDIMDKVKKRSKSITLKPNGSSNSTSSNKKGKAKTEQDVIDNAAERMAKVFA